MGRLQHVTIIIPPEASKAGGGGGRHVKGGSFGPLQKDME